MFPAGGILYPLSVATLGFWTPISTRIMKSHCIEDIVHQQQSLRPSFLQLEATVFGQARAYNSRLLHAYDRIQLEEVDDVSWDVPTLAC